MQALEKDIKELEAKAEAKNKKLLEYERKLRNLPSYIGMHLVLTKNENIIQTSFSVPVLLKYVAF